MPGVLPQTPEDILNRFVDFTRARGGRQGARDDGMHGRRPSVEHGRERRNIFYDKMTERLIVQEQCLEI